MSTKAYTRAGPQKKGTASRDDRREAALQRRVGDVVGIDDLMARVLRITLAQARCHPGEAA